MMPTTSPSAEQNPSTPTSIALIQQLRTQLLKIYKGPTQSVDLLLAAFLAGGHVLIEDVPGVGKTTLAKALAQSCQAQFRRIQATADTLPADITGLSIFNQAEQRFVFHEGPLFTNILLVDELNRMPPRSQSALLEAMAEGQVSVDGATRRLSDDFFCIATQNPFEHAGTYLLPESQCDRFLFRFQLGYPQLDNELALLASDGAEEQLANAAALCQLSDVHALRQHCRQISISEELRRYIVDLCTATRQDKRISLGVSPRGALALQRAAQAWALLQQRDYVIPDDIQFCALPVLGHRILCSSDISLETLIKDLLELVAVPR